jgi:hypothetical protein
MNIINFVFYLRLLSFIGLISLQGQCVNLGNPQGIGPTGLLYSHYHLGYSENKSPDLPSKTGKACVKRYAFLFTAGDASIQAAANSGNITEIKSTDKEAFNVLMLYSSLCTIVRGN